MLIMLENTTNEMTARFRTNWIDSDERDFNVEQSIAEKLVKFSSNA